MDRTGEEEAGEGPFLRDWILANGTVEAAGLGSTFVIGTAVASRLDVPGPGGVLLMAAAAVLSGAVLEGLVVGEAQGRVLRRHRASIQKRAWVLAGPVASPVP